MQVNIAPKLANFLSSTSKGKHPKCSDENHTVIVDSLRLVYRGIQTICSALLDKDQFKQPDFEFKEAKIPVENGANERSESVGSKSPDDEYFDRDVMEIARLGGIGGRLWGTHSAMEIRGHHVSKGKETSL